MFEYIQSCLVNMLRTKSFHNFFLANIIISTEVLTMEKSYDQLYYNFFFFKFVKLACVITVLDELHIFFGSHLYVCKTYLNNSCISCYQTNDLKSLRR